MSRKLMLVAAVLLFPIAAAHAEHCNVVTVAPYCHETHVHYVAPVCVTPVRVCVTPAPVCVHPAPVCVAPAPVCVHPVVTRTVTTTTVTTQSVHYIR